MAAKTLENLLSKNYRPELTSQSYNTNTVFPTSPSPSGVQGSSRKYEYFLKYLFINK